MYNEQLRNIDGNPEKDWPEDWGHENGQYYCRCMYCRDMFIGYKRRVVCKQCSSIETKQTPENPTIKHLLSCVKTDTSGKWISTEEAEKLIKLAICHAVGYCGENLSKTVSGALMINCGIIETEQK